jgi:hypothetical protein
MKNGMLALTWALAGCGHVVMGSGAARDETREVAAFCQIAVEGGLKTEIAIGSPAEVVVSGDDNVTPLIKTDVSGDLLTLAPEEMTSFTEKTPLVIRITTPSLTALTLSGGSKARMSGQAAASSTFALEASGGSEATLGISARDLAIEASGGSTLCVSGDAVSATVEASGGSRVTASDLPVEEAEVSASGGSEVHVRASQKVKADASGGSQVRVAGTATLEENASGGSSVTRE